MPACGSPVHSSCPSSTRFRRIQAIDGIPTDVPVLILSGAADPLATPAEAKALLARVASHGELAFFPGADHNSVFVVGPGSLPAAGPRFPERLTRQGNCRSTEVCCRNPLSTFPAEPGIPNRSVGLAALKRLWRGVALDCRIGV